ncbi:hypothetical protein, partial [Accumulibacter sp.]|uniref:hypothetical protein n=1 Tax=Accumulibacter sp. TaxID=2053492 RepID=UPI00258E3EB1
MDDHPASTRHGKAGQGAAMNRESVLLTDLYQLTMLQAYYERGMNEVAVFEFFVRKLR